MFSGEASDVTVGASFDDTPGFERTLISRATDFFNSEVHELTADGELLRIDVPTDASASIHREWLLIELKSSWQVGDIEYSAGTLLAARYRDYVAGDRTLTPVFVPDEHASLHHYAWTRDRLTVAILRDVASEILVFTPEAGAPNRCPAFQTTPQLRSSPSMISVTRYSSTLRVSLSLRRCCAARSAGWRLRVPDQGGAIVLR